MQRRPRQRRIACVRGKRHVWVADSEDQIAAIEKAKADKEAHGTFESEHPGFCGARVTFYVGVMEGVGRIYQQTFVDTYSKVALAKLYDRKTPICAGELLNAPSSTSTRYRCSAS